MNDSTISNRAVSTNYGKGVEICACRATTAGGRPKPAVLFPPAAVAARLAIYLFEALPVQLNWQHNLFITEQIHFFSPLLCFL
ncbi:hypothetical protein T4A_12008 [Trichinella pseudospiralis]|uniref:Uncharacterized protein n=1 Tax=Trichinella pseudospiralis TaxID=6337 RepID=A0A0V1EAD4_TRIPS|nr:hypothetical protein T4A_12008 [Trichinella pseudospiralis]